MAIKKPAARLTIILCAWLAFFNLAYAERITNFESYVTLNEDGSFVVTETIVYDFEDEQRRGIYRNIKNQHAQPASTWYKNRSIELELLDVKRDGALEPYTLEAYDGLSVRIGDENIYHSGTHTYEITYAVDGAIATYDDGLQEFYWNVTGDEWVVPIDSTRLTLNATQTLFGTDADCYAGVSGSVTTCLTVNTNTPTQVEFISGPLLPGEQLTVAQSLQLTEIPRVIETINWYIVVIPLAILGLLIPPIYLYRWKFFHKYPTTIIPQYEPLPDFKPMFTGVLFDGRLDARDITAGIVYLAEQGFIKIKAVEKQTLLVFNETDYEITLLRPFNEVETDFQRVLLSLLFGGETTNSFDFKRLFTKFEAHTETIKTEHLVGTSVTLSKLKDNETRLRENAQLLQSLNTAVKADLQARGYFELRPLSLKGKTILWVPIIIVLIVVLFSAVGFIAFIAFFIFVVFGLERRTRKGYEALYYLRGFKDFLTVTEQERYKMLNAPSRTPEQFMEYLPYAIAFGVEKEWAKAFADIAIANPDWYQDTSISGSTFNAVAFSSAISGFSNSFSSSSGTSSSSGGGSSGGGSGGGGGGSW